MMIQVVMLGEQNDNNGENGDTTEGKNDGNGSLNMKQKQMKTRCWW